MSADLQVALFATNFLHYSQTFIYEQLQNHRRYEPHVFCWRRHNADRFPYPRVHRANLAYGLTRRSPAFDRVFAREGFDVVHAHFAPGAVYALPYAERHRVPLVTTFHGYDVPLYWNARRFRPEYLPFLLHGREVLERMTLGLCASNELKELLVSLGVPEARLRVHRLGIDLGRFRPAERAAADPVEMLCVGRFVEKKGFEYAIRAFAPHAGRARLSLVGDGPLGQHLRGLVASLGIGDAVQFVGVLSQDEVAARIARSDVLVAPSVVGRDGDRESGLIVAKEASACGLPVVATVHGGLPEIVEHGVTGYLAPERDVDALSRYLGLLVDDPAARAAFGRAGRAKMEREYDARLQGEALEALYDEARALYRSS